jgi:predicted phosphodiesterase
MKNLLISGVMKNMQRVFFLFFLLCAPLQLFSQIKIIHGPYLQAMGEDEVTVVWVTDKPAVSWVEIAPAGDNSFYAEERPKYYQTSHGNKVVGVLNKITVHGLEKGTEYRYRVFSREVLSHSGHKVMYGDIASTNVYSRTPLRFRTLDGDKQEISFAVINDIHSRVDDLNALCKDIRYGTSDFVIFNGDMVSVMNSEEQFFAGFMDDAVRMFAGEVPVFFARGNHETRGSFSVHFPEYFPTTSGKLYYSFRQGPVHFIVLDAGEDKPDSDIEYSELAMFDDYRSKQAEWLKKEIEKEDFRSAKYRAVIIHIPPSGSGWHGPLDVQRKFLPILNNTGIDVMICGHTHRYMYIEPDQNLNDFPILINAHTTGLYIKASGNEMTVTRKDTEGKTLNTFTYRPSKSN